MNKLLRLKLIRKKKSYRPKKKYKSIEFHIQVHVPVRI